MYAQPPLRLLLKTVGLFLLIDFPFQLVVNGMNPPFALVLQPVLNDPADMLEQTECSHRSRPASPSMDAVQKLRGIDITVIRSRVKIPHCLFVIPIYISPIEIQLSELIFSVVISFLRCDLEVSNGSLHIPNGFLCEKNLSGKIRRIRILLCRSLLQIIHSRWNILRDYLSTIKDLSN